MCEEETEFGGTCFLMSLANDLCAVLCVCTICAAAVDINELAPAEALVPCILHCEKPNN